MSTSTGHDRPDDHDQPAGGLSRRRFLALGGATAGGALASSLLPPSLQAAIAKPPPRGGLDQVRHVVLLMQENRSFDHYYGTLRGVAGYGDRTVLRRRGGGTVFEQPTGDASGSVVLPFGVRDAAERADRNLQYVASLPHGWPDGQAAWARGWYDGWVPAKGPATMAGYDRADIPFQFELAETFTLCDHYFCSVPTSTSPNRNYFVSGYTGFEPGSTDRAVTNAAYDEDNHPGYDWVTYPELLEQAGVSWRVYQEWDNFGDNNLEFFAAFKAIMREALAPIEGGRHLHLTSFYGSLWDRPPAEQDRLLAELDASVAALPDAERRLFDRGLRRTRPETLASSFAADVAAGQLPAVSYLVPSAADSEHPGTSSPIESARITYDVLDVLASHPDVWARTVLLVTYDEFDGYFDHVPPPVPPRSVADEHWGDQPIGLGFRVPMVVVSPWTVGGWVSSEVFDHSSMVQLLERWTGVRTDQISDWRRTVAGDLVSTFDFDGNGAGPQLAQPGSVPPFTGRWEPAPPADQALPAQEPGTRPARPLPYQPDAWGVLQGRRLRLSLVNRGERPVHFAVYGWADETGEPVHLDVEDRDVVELALADGQDRYDVTVTAANRFVRELAGSIGGPAGRLVVASEVPRRGRRLAISLTNRSRTPLDITVAPLAYSTRDPLHVRLRPGQERQLRWSTSESHGWYDVEITVAQDPTFRRRLTGHLEDGNPSISA